MSLFFNQLAERAIAKAQQQGELDNLPNQGKSLDLDDDYARTPETLRMGYKILKNSGFLPPELEARQEAVTLAKLIASTDDRDEMTLNALDRKLKRLLQKMEVTGFDTRFIEEYLRQKSP